MNVVDSSGWLEYFVDGPNAATFAAPIQDALNLVVPTISTYEVFKVVRREASRSHALTALAAMRAGHLVSLDEALALDAAELSLAHGLPMAGSIILATTRRFKATLWTQDADFEGLNRVRYISKR